jgi:hypothetical protein
VIAGEKGEDLRGFAVFCFAETDAAVGGEGHGGVIIWALRVCWRNDQCPMPNVQRMTNDQ